jgi:hypothetical protein
MIKAVTVEDWRAVKPLCASEVGPIPDLLPRIVLVTRLAFFQEKRI